MKVNINTYTIKLIPYTIIVIKNNKTNITKDIKNKFNSLNIDII